MPKERQPDNGSNRESGEKFFAQAPALSLPKGGGAMARNLSEILERSLRDHERKYGPPEDGE